MIFFETMKTVDHSIVQSGNMDCFHPECAGSQHNAEARSRAAHCASPNTNGASHGAVMATTCLMASA